MGIKDQLLEQLNRTNDMPFLFVGSGMSKRYLGLETWSELLRRFADMTEDPYDFYQSEANGDLPHVASLVAEGIRKIWWKRPEFEPTRTAFGSPIVRRDLPLKIEIAAYMKTIVDRDTPSDVRGELELLRSIAVDGIITTNWDCFLERQFPDFQQYIGQDALLFANPQEIAEIYKIHGCCTDPASLVLTAEDYEGFHNRNPYLAAKLLTIFIEHPIVFLGYSISDPHISKILDSIAQCLTEARLRKLTDRLIFVEYDREDLGDTMRDRLTSKASLLHA
jgi:hypothetical protein